MQMKSLIEAMERFCRVSLTGKNLLGILGVKNTSYISKLEKDRPNDKFGDYRNYPFFGQRIGTESESFSSI